MRLRSSPALGSACAANAMTIATFFVAAFCATSAFTAAAMRCCSVAIAAASVPRSVGPSTASDSVTGVGSMPGSAVWVAAPTVLAARKIAKSPRRMSAHSHPASESVTPRPMLSTNLPRGTDAADVARVIDRRRHRLGCAREVARRDAEIAHDDFEVRKLLLAFHRTLVDPALLGDHVVEHGVRGCVGQRRTAREAERMTEQEADLRFAQQDSGARAHIAHVG